MNKISITIRSKIDGATVFDSADYSHIPAGIPVMDVIDDSLDSFTFTVKDILQRKPFQPFDLVTFTITDGESTDEFQYFVLNDNAKTYRNLDNDARWYPRSSYEHTIACVETTKYLEKIKVFELTMTNKHDTLLKQFRKAMNNIEPPIGVGYGSTVSMTSPSRFSMTEELATLLEGVESCDFSFQNTDARTIFDEILARVNARVVVHNVDFDAYGRYTITLGYHLLDVATDVVPTWTFDGHGQIVHEEMGSDGQDYAGTIVARGYNSIPDEPLTVRLTPTSTQATFSTESAILALPIPVSNKGIEFFGIELTVSYKLPDDEDSAAEDTTEYTVRRVFDLSNLLVWQEEYELLNEDNKKSKIAYQLNTKEITLGKTYSKMFGWTAITLKDKINEVISTYIKEEGLIFFDVETIDSATFVVRYYPLLDTVASIQKTDEPNLSLMAVMDSQTEQTLDISRHGKKLAGLLKRVGNDSYVVDVKAQKYSGLLSLLSRIDVDGEKYVLYKREYAVYNDFVNGRYYFSQNYTAVQENAGVNRERQIYSIPLEDSETPIVIRQTLEFSTVAPSSSERTPFSSVLPFAALNTLIGLNGSFCEDDVIYDTETDENIDHYVSGRLTYLYIKSYCGNDLIAPDEGYKYVFPIASYALDNTMYFMAKPLDNYSAGYSKGGFEFSDWGDGGRKIRYNEYVISDGEKYPKRLGEADSFYLYYSFDFSTDDDTMYTLAPLPKRIPETYPKILDTDITNSAMGTTDSVSNVIIAKYEKDRTQTPMFVLSMNVTVAKADQKKIIVHPIFAKKNNLVRDNGEGLNVSLFIRTDTSISETESVVADETFSLDDVFSVIRGTDGVYAILRPIKDSASVDLTPEGSWGIVDESGQVYLAVNGEFCDIYLSCKEQ